MTPEARVQTACELLDGILAGQSAEQALTRWARASRYAGSKDRAAVRSLVFDALRRKRSYAAFGGSVTGRGLMMGALRACGCDPSDAFTGKRYAPAAITAAERARFGTPDAAEQRDFPDWLWPEFAASLGHAADSEARLLRNRAEVDLRVNLLKSDRPAAQKALRDEGIETEPNPLSNTALRITKNARQLRQTQAFQSGVVELQDAASQAVVDELGLRPGISVLDYCAGGGGKALAMAARTRGPIVAHDIDPARMGDIPARSIRAGADIRVNPTPKGQFELVLCDTACSGSGSWRRAPEAKWRLTGENLRGLRITQDTVLDAGADFVAPGGALAYATCSLLESENSARIADFLVRNRGWQQIRARQFTLSDGADGFFVSLLRRV